VSPCDLARFARYCRENERNRLLDRQRSLAESTIAANTRRRNCLLGEVRFASRRTVRGRNSNRRDSASYSVQLPASFGQQNFERGDLKTLTGQAKSFDARCLGYRMAAVVEPRTRRGRVPIVAGIEVFLVKNLSFRTNPDV
jgi:hypothetical protein